VDAVKDSLYNEINKNKDRKKALFKRGALKIKEMIKGISRKNSFTSK